MSARDGHVRVLPLHVANKIAAGEVVERPASVVKELLENAIDAGAATIRITIAQGGRKLVSVQDDGCGMSRDDAVLSLERQATSKILDVDDIERIDSLGFRGEAIPSIASVSRFSLVTRRRDSDEGTRIVVNAGTLAEVSAAGCPVGTLVEVRDLFCNVPARRKFLRAYGTEESHVKSVFTTHALAHPAIGFSLTIDGRELYRLAPSATLSERLLDLFGDEFTEHLLPLEANAEAAIRVNGFIERPNLAMPTRREQYVFINGRPATAPTIAYALREAYPRRPGDVRPAAIIFIDMPVDQVDVNVHPTKREVRFRDNTAVKQALEQSIRSALNAPFSTPATGTSALPEQAHPPVAEARPKIPDLAEAPVMRPPDVAAMSGTTPPMAVSEPAQARTVPAAAEPPEAAPVQVEFAVEPDSTASRPWIWFKVLATTASGYLLVETDSGIVTVNPHAARERIAFEALTRRHETADVLLQELLLPEIVRLSPTDAARVRNALPAIEANGFKIEEFGTDTFKIDAVPQLLGSLSPTAVLSTIAHDLAEASGVRKNGTRWREELIAKSVARSFAGSSIRLDEKEAQKLVEELASCRMPYVCPRGKPIMIFTSTRELDRKFSRA